MKKWKYEIMAGTLLLLVSIRINEIEIGTLVGLVCLIRGLEELYRQTGDQRFRYACRREIRGSGMPGLQDLERQWFGLQVPMK